MNFPETKTKIINSLLAVLPAVWWCSSVMAAEVSPFTAHYEVSIDGKPRLEVTMTLQRKDEAWQFSSHTIGTHGLARMLKASSDESVQLRATEAGFEPLAFSAHSRLAGSDDRWSARFDWPASMVYTRHEDGESALPIDRAAGPVVDPLSLTLALRQKLQAGLKNIELQVVDEKDISPHHYHASKHQHLDTTLGCLKVIPVERIRENSKRYSTGWYAEALQFLPVRVLHGKRGGKEFDMRLTQLSVDGKSIPNRAPCTG